MKPFLVLLASLLPLAALHAAEPPPNIILVMPDDVGYGDCACLGNPIMRMPRRWMLLKTRACSLRSSMSALSARRRARR